MAKARRSGFKGLLKGLLGILVTIGMFFLLYLLIVIFGTLLPVADPNLVNIQSYIDWAHESFDFLISNLPGFVLFASVLGGGGVVTYLAIKSK